MSHAVGESEKKKETEKVKEPDLVPAAGERKRRFSAPKVNVGDLLSFWKTQEVSRADLVFVKPDTCAGTEEGRC